MWFSRKQVARPPAGGGVSAAGADTQAGQITTKRIGDAAESLARDHLMRAGLTLRQANYRTPGRGGGEVDLIMAAPDGTLVFVEVRRRKSSSHGGAGASIGAVKQRRVIFAARHYLMRFATPPPCRFDVVLVEGAPDAPGGVTLQWLRGAFDADGDGSGL
jgi:putative endonuclease